jgi:hypothetical protein
LVSSAWIRKRKAFGKRMVSLKVVMLFENYGSLESSQEDLKKSI